MKLSERLNEKCIRIGSKSTDKRSLIEELVDVAVAAHGLKHRDQILESVLERESKMSTGIGCGLGVPHAKVDCVDQMYLVGMSVRSGLDFEAIDKEPVYLLFLMISPLNTVGPHIRALSSVSRIMADAPSRRALIEAESPAQFMQILRTAEEKYQ